MILNASHIANRWAHRAAWDPAEAVPGIQIIPAKVRSGLGIAVHGGVTAHRCYNAGELLYIGSSINMVGRILSHRHSTPWWSDVERIDYEEHATERAARHAEALAIIQAPGLYNLAGTPRDRRVRRLA